MSETDEGLRTDRSRRVEGNDDGTCSDGVEEQRELSHWEGEVRGPESSESRFGLGGRSCRDKGSRLVLEIARERTGRIDSPAARVDILARTEAPTVPTSDC